MNFVIYIVGALIVIAGLAYGANRLGISSTWIMVGAAVIMGLAVMAGITQTRQKDPPA